MAYSALPTFSPGDVLTAANMNNVGDNFAASPIALATTAGQIPYATGANAMVMLALGASGQILKAGASAPEWGDVDTALTRYIGPVLIAKGSAVVGAATFEFEAPFAFDWVRIDIYVKTAPTGAALIVDVNDAGSTIFSTQANRPQIAAAAGEGNTTTFNDTSVASGARVTIDVDQIGSTVAGADLHFLATVKPT